MKAPVCLIKLPISKRIFLVLLTLCAIPLYSQKSKVTYYGDIESIVLANCATCHRPGKAGPFPLLSYDDVRKKGAFIANVTSSRYMPPWKADASFQSYKNARLLTGPQINAIQQWVAAGMPKGKRMKQGPAVTAPKNDDDLKPDVSLTLKEPYAIMTDGSDDYRFFNLPTNMPRDEYVTRIEFIPGNPRLVHHSRLMTDTSHNVRSIHGMSAKDPGISQFEKYPPLDKFLYGWVPGNFPITFPPGTGKKLYKDTDIILNIHYSPNRREGQTDQSVVNFYFAKEPISREIYSLAIAEESISNPPFEIKANEKKTFYSSFGPIPVDISAVGVLPHMHYLGKTFKAFAITPADSAVHLIKIDAWDFKWQDTYQFSKLLHIPKGSIILMEATFDNTSDNPANPSVPPKDVGYGWDSGSEMMDLVLYYMLYKPGDEAVQQ